ncbi:MAG: DMT family transporter [Burkholderiaceae bacterium]|nr:MAG: DMT family transporter [Burkholderiaceae bacterium]
MRASVHGVRSWRPAPGSPDKHRLDPTHPAPAIPIGAPSPGHGLSSRLFPAVLMSVTALFWIPALIWASTWHVILYQLGEVPPLNSVAYRFMVAAALMAALTRWQGHSLKLPLRWHLPLAVVGCIQFGLNYCSTYESERHLPSGLVAVLFSLMVFGNAAAGAVFFRQPFTRRFFLASLVAVSGVVMVFWPEIAGVQARPGLAQGLMFGGAAVVAAVVGNVLTLMLTRRGLPLMPVLSWAMLYGSLSLLLFSVLSGTGLHVSAKPSYWLSLLYLAVMGSTLAFWFYFRLAQSQGAGKAAMVSVIVPVIALGVSAVLENWQPTWMAGVGMLLAVGGVLWATRPAPAAPAASSGPDTEAGHGD